MESVSSSRRHRRIGSSTVAQAVGDGSQRFGCSPCSTGRKRPRVCAAAHRSEPDVVKRQVPRKRLETNPRQLGKRRAAQQDRTLPAARGKSLIENVRGTSACGEEVDGRSGSYASLRSSGGVSRKGARRVRSLVRSLRAPHLTWATAKAPNEMGAVRVHADQTVRMSQDT